MTVTGQLGQSTTQITHRQEPILVSSLQKVILDVTSGSCELMICFLLDEHQLTGRDFKSTPRMDNSLTSFNNRHGSNGMKPTMMAMAGASIAGQSNATLRSQQPFSFKSAID